MIFCGECLRQVSQSDAVLLVRQDANGRPTSATWICCQCLGLEFPEQPVLEAEASAGVKLDDARDALIRATLEHTDGAVGQAARMLGLSRMQLWRHCRRLGIDVKQLDRMAQEAAEEE